MLAYCYYHYYYYADTSFKCVPRLPALKIYILILGLDRWGGLRRWRLRSTLSGGLPARPPACLPAYLPGYLVGPSFDPSDRSLARLLHD